VKYCSCFSERFLFKSERIWCASMLILHSRCRIAVCMYQSSCLRIVQSPGQSTSTAVFSNPLQQQAFIAGASKRLRMTRASVVCGAASPRYIPQHGKNVAVIGAGAAGLVSAKELLQLGHNVVVYEQNSTIGGVWAYTEDVEDDLLGISGERKKVHGSMYKYLRTNLPREVMGVADFPFDSQFAGSKDSRRYCSHEEVYRYLEAYAKHFDILKHVQFSSRIESVMPAKDGWHVCVHEDDNNAILEKHFDAVVVCNGHYSEPRVPVYDGQSEFPGKQMHSHNYRTPDVFVGKRIVVVGAAFSGSDISQEILEHGAQAVYLSGRNWEDLAEGLRLEDSRQVLKVPNISSLNSNGSVTFVDATIVEDVDVVMYATGYLYDFPFMKNVDGAPEVSDNRLCTLYKHVFPPKLAPSLSFVGIPWKVVPFPQFQLQARWIGSCLNGTSNLPSADEMEKEVEAMYSEHDAQGLEKRYTHRMNPESQSEYNNWLASQVDEKSIGWPEWRKTLYIVSGMNRRQNGIKFREFSLEDMGAKQALEEFHKEAQHIRQSWLVSKIN
jgi:thioredoxin reductase